MNKTRIEWTGYTWNPIKGLCLVDCKLPDGKSYCYARRMYQRFDWNPELSLETMVNPPHRKRGSKIFICSTIELFHPQIKREWRDYIFSVIKDLPYFTFQILTKFPENIDRDMPDNVWLGVSVTNGIDIPQLIFLNKAKARIKFVSYEPFLERVGTAMLGYYQFPTEEKIDWLIIGRLTGHGKKYDPKKGWIEEFVESAEEYNIPIFLKNNLKSIWGENLIQEFPE